MTSNYNQVAVQPVLSASASAPGKLILFGEHAVVFGQPAIAACLSDLRIKVDASTRLDGILSIVLPDLKPEPVSIQIPLLSIKVEQLLHKNSGNGINGDDIGTGNTSIDWKTLLAEKGPPNTDDVKAIHETLTKLSSGGTSDNDIKININIKTKQQQILLSDLQISALTPLIYLINTMILPTILYKGTMMMETKTNMDLNSNSKNYGLSIIAKSQNLPLGAGLGSSAAFSVAASASLYKLYLLLSSSNNDRNGNSCDDDDEDDDKNNNNRPAKKIKTDHGQKLKEQVQAQPTKEQLDIINTLAFYSETLIHGTPSGIDNTVSTYGGALQYIKTKYGSQKQKKEQQQVNADNTAADADVDKKESETIFLDNFPQLNVILTNTNVPRSTKVLVHGVKTLKENDPDIVNPILDSIGHISRYVRHILNDKLSSPSNAIHTALLLVLVIFIHTYIHTCIYCISILYYSISNHLQM